MKRVAILQARMGSTRLPGKILKPILGKPMLAYQLERLGRCRQLDQFIVATTTNPADDTLAAFCETVSIPVYRGSEQDVLRRYYEAAVNTQADCVVRLTGDCPLIDPSVVDSVILAFQSAEPAVDYASNTLERTFPRGLDVEVFSVEALAKAHRTATESYEREHVTPYIYRHPETFKLLQHRQIKDYSHLRWTVDTPEDFALIEKILTAFYPQNPLFSHTDVLDLLAKHPEWNQINAHVEQVKVPD